ncbi:MAG: DUF2442 domain-containing protein [Planctomycetes bacterium]|nr:DUF2442 domain-containing protein [Planctomycetota bacterium]
MTSSTITINPTAVDVKVTDETLTVSLSDGRVVSVPISWYPRLSHALQVHREIWEFNGAGHGVHWPEIDEDISVENLLFGQPSGESSSSLTKWKECYKQKNFHGDDA